MGVKNDAFFRGKTYAQIFEQLNFNAHLDFLAKKLKGKKVAIYGTGIMFDHIVQSFDLRVFDVRVVSDRRFESKPVSEYRGFPALSPKELSRCDDIDAILIATLYPVGLKKYVEGVIFKDKKAPRVYFLINKPFSLFWEDIFG